MINFNTSHLWVDHVGSGVSPTDQHSIGNQGSHKSQNGEDFEGMEDAYQASLKGRHYELFNFMDEKQPDKSREIFNNYFQLNNQIEVLY